MSGCAPAWGYNTKFHVLNKREVTPLFWVDLISEWYEDAMVFLISLVLFLFRTNGKKGHLYENDFRHCYGIFFFESDILKVTWSQLCSKFLLNNYKAHWKQHFERYPKVEIYEHGSTCVLNLSSRLQ